MKHICLLLCILLMASCTSKTSGYDGKSLPDMTFAHLQPLNLNVADVEINNNYDPNLNDRDMSIDLPVSPDIAVKRYAESRFEAVGTRGKFIFTIENANTGYELIEPEGSLKQWMGVDRSEKFDVSVIVRFFYIDGLMNESPHSVMEFKRSITIPYSYSLARKEHEQFKFIEVMTKDIDEAITQTIQTKYPELLAVATSYGSATEQVNYPSDNVETRTEPSATYRPENLLTAPEVR